MTRKLMDFIEKVRKASVKNNTLVCVGLDTDLKKIPSLFNNQKNAVYQFNKSIIDSTADAVCAFKPQIAYYSGVRGEQELELTIDYIHNNYPDIPVILDAKRGDIGSTAEMYAREVFDRYNADAVTINPYLGGDTLKPYLDRKNKGIIILCRTSNPGAKDIQNLECNGKKIYQIVAEKAVNEWNYNKNILLVVGATYPKELKEIRLITGTMPFLVPGIGAQGGDIKQAVSNGKSSDGMGMIINSSRGIIYAGKDNDFADQAYLAACSLRDQINVYR